MYEFIPAIRHGSNEQKALQKLNNQLSGQTGSHQLKADKVKPLIEIIDNDDINNLNHYTSIYGEVFVDFPRYLSARDSKHKDNIMDLIASYSNDPIKFHQQNVNQNYTPVISGLIDSVEHPGFEQCIRKLSSDFDRLCIRLFVPTDPYNPSDKNQIRNIIGASRDDDAILADAPDVAKLSSGIRPNIEFLKGEIDQQDFYVFDLFEPRGEVNYNYGLVMGKHAEADGLGDFVLEPRFPQDIPPGAFNNIPKRVRQYESSIHTVRTTEDSDHYINAIEIMIHNGDLVPSHCPACRELYDEYQTAQQNPNRKDLHSGFLKRMRINHYAYSILDQEFPSMDVATDAKDFDNDGHADII